LAYFAPLKKVEDKMQRGITAAFSGLRLAPGAPAAMQMLQCRAFASKSAKAKVLTVSKGEAAVSGGQRHSFFWGVHCAN
jgi:hypothetical protein